MKYLKIALTFFIIVLMIFPSTPTIEQKKSDDQENQNGTWVNETDQNTNISKLLLETYSLSEIISANVSTLKSDDAIDGNNLFVLREINTNTSGTTMFAVVTDMEGSVLYERKLGANYSLVNSPIEFINSTAVLTGDPNGAFLWDIVTNKTRHFNFTGHHEYEYNHGSNSIFTFNYSIVNITGTNYLYDVILEYNEAGNVIWSLDTASFIPTGQACHEEHVYLGAIDLTHSNTIYYDEVDDVIYYNSRNTNTFYKINHTSGDIIWGLGEFGDFTLFNDVGVEQQSLFWHAHAVERVDNNTFIIFDNDYDNPLLPADRRSSILEITINETTMTANTSWIWKPSSNQYWTHRWGDADRLPNGNRLGTFGTEFHGTTPYGARLVEVNKMGDIVWKMDFINNAKFEYGIYRMERFRFAPILTSVDDFYSESGQDVCVNWDAYYNFRPKRSITGEYELFLNNVSIDTGFINYDRYWRPFNASFNLGSLSDGLYNVTLVVTDGEGHNATDSVNVLVTDLYVARSGPLLFEQGMEDNMITWSGFSANPMTCNVTLNDTIYSTSEWNGSIIPLYLEELSLGKHQVEFEVYNETITVYVENFWIDVYPREVPIFLAIPDNTTMEWNDTISLVWEVYDATPHQWHIYINGSHNMTDVWGSSQSLLEWNIPTLEEAVYNITIVTEDQTGHSSKDDVIVTVIPPTPPAIVSRPDDGTIFWGEPDELFLWEFHGGTNYELWRNDTLLQNDTIQTKNFTFVISDWHEDGWRKGVHNLTFVLKDNYTLTTCTSLIEVVINPGDPYANSVVDTYSAYFLSGNRALGRQDGRFAIVYTDYSNGYLTLDMGKSEEIIDGSGNDFTVYAGGGMYSISVAVDLISGFSHMGYFSGNQSLDLSSIAIDDVRYVRITYFSGNETEIDSIEAIYHNTRESDDDAPIIIGIDDFSIWVNQTYTNLTWSGTDSTPWSYSILINGSVDVSGTWYGSEINYTFWPASIGTWNVSLLLQDAFDNVAIDTVLIKVRSIPVVPTVTTTDTSDSATNTSAQPDTFVLELMIIVGSVSIGIAVVVVVIIRKRSQ